MGKDHLGFLARLLKQSDAVTCMVELTDGTVIRRHLDHLKLNMTNQVART